MINKKLILTIVIIVIIAAAGLFYWWWSSRTNTEAPSAGELDQINQDLNELNANDIDKEFEGIDQDLNNL